METQQKHELERTIDGLTENHRVLMSLVGPANPPSLGVYQEFLQQLEPDLLTAIRQGRSVLRQLDVLQEVIHSSAAINSSLALDQVLEGILDAVIGFTGAERAYLMLQDEQTQELTIRAARNANGPDVKGGTAFSSSIVEDALAQQKAVVSLDALQDQRFSGMQSIMLGRMRSIVCIPMLIQGKAIGVLYADSRAQPDLFDGGILPLLTAFGAQAAIAIKNASEFGQVKVDLEEARQEVMKLRVEVDRHRMKDEIDAVTGSDYFQSLAGIAKERRKNRHK